MTTSKKMEDYLKKINGRRPTKKMKMEDDLKKMEDEKIIQNQPNWL